MDIFSLPEPKAHKVSLLVLQQSNEKVASFWDTGPRKVTSSNIHQIKAESLPGSKLHDAISKNWGENFYGPSKQGTHMTNETFKLNLNYFNIPKYVILLSKLGINWLNIDATIVKTEHFDTKR